MSNLDLASVYSILFEEEFKNDVFRMKKNLQKAVYLLQEMGIPVGDYSFMWYKYGPFSHTLADEMKLEGFKCSCPQDLNVETKKAIELLKAIFDTANSYEKDTWIECIGSLHFLLTYLLPQKEHDNVITELMRRKPHLDDQSTNILALEKVKALLSGGC